MVPSGSRRKESRLLMPGLQQLDFGSAQEGEAWVILVCVSVVGAEE